jgi:hypothetical protein
MPMIISVHIPKTAGTTFAQYLLRAFPDGVLSDYGSETPDVSEVFESCFKNITNFREDGEFQIRLISEGILKCKRLLAQRGIQVIHGHFDIYKYLGIFPEATYVVWLREPLERALSHYHFHRRVLITPHDPTNRLVYEGQLSFEEWMHLPDVINLQFRLVMGDLSRFQFVGIAEQFKHCLSDFGRIAGLEQNQWDSEIPPENINPEKRIDEKYEIDEQVRSRFIELNHRDIALYRAAVERLNMTGSG